MADETYQQRRERLFEEFLKEKAPATTDEAPAPSKGSAAPKQGTARKMAGAAATLAKGAALDNPLVDSLKATVGGFQAGGKAIADAAVPPPGATAGAVGRTADAGLGVLDMVMSALGVHGGAAFFQSIVERGAGANADQKVPLPDVVRDGLRTAEALFTSPKSIREMSATDDAGKQKLIAGQRENMHKDFTYKELAGFLGGLAGPIVAHGAPSAKGAPAPAAAPTAQAAAAAAKPVTRAGAVAAAPVDPGPMPTNPKLVPAWVAARTKVLDYEKQQQAAAQPAPAAAPAPAAPAAAPGGDWVDPEIAAMRARREALAAPPVEQPAAPQEAVPPVTTGPRPGTVQPELPFPGEGPGPQGELFQGVGELRLPIVAPEGAQALEKPVEQPAALAPATPEAPRVDPQEPAWAPEAPNPASAAIPAGPQAAPVDEAMVGTEAGPTGAPQVQTLRDVHDTIAPAMVEPPTPERPAGPPTLAEVQAAKEGSAALAQDMRRQQDDFGKRTYTEAQIRDAVRAHLNSAGLLSKSQLEAAAKERLASPEAQAPEVRPEHVDLEALRSEIEDIKTKAAQSEIKAALLDLRGSLAHAKQTWAELFGDETGALGAKNDKLTPAVKAGVAVLNRASAVGAAVIAGGARSLKAFSAQMIEHFGDWIQPYLAKMYEDSKAQLAEFKDKGRVLTPAGAEKALFKGIGNVLWYDWAPEKLRALYQPLVNALSADHPRAGTDAVHLAADTYAATSNGTRADTTNITLADRAIRMMLADPASKEYRNGFDKPFTLKDNVSAGARQNSILNQLNQVARGEELTAVKTGPYGDTLGRSVAGPPPRIVLDRWMKALFFPDDRVTDPVTGIESPGKILQPEQAYMEHVIEELARKHGLQPYQVQAAMWKTAKMVGETQTILKRAKRYGWNQARISEALAEASGNIERPFDQLVQERLQPDIQAAVHGDLADNAGEAYLGRMVSAELMKPESAADPEGAATLGLQKAGVSLEAAQAIVPRILDAIKARVMSTDPEGGQFSQTSIGFNPLDLFRIFHKDADLAGAPYDKATTAAGIKAVADKIPELLPSLKLDLTKTVSEDQAKTVRATAEAASVNVQAVMDRIEAGAITEPGELHHAVTVAAAVAEKARNAEARAGGGFGTRGPDMVRPVTAETLQKFSEALHRMSEPELFNKLSQLDKDGTGNWLANMYRASTVPSLMSGAGIQKMFMSLYYNEALSDPYTLGKSLVNHVTVLPYTVALTAASAQIGKLTKSADRAVPGQASQLWAGFWSAAHDGWNGLAAGDYKGVKTIMEQEGDLHVPRPDPVNWLETMLNATSAPSFALGAIRSPIKVTLRRGALFAETFRQATQEGLAGDKFWERVAELRREPTSDIMKKTNEFSDVWSFTKRYNSLIDLPLLGKVRDPRGLVQTNGLLGDTGRIFLDPFANIGVNTVSRALESHPMTALISPDFWAAMKTGGGERDLALAKLAIGSAILATTIGLGAMGVCTGDGPPDPLAQKIWREAGNVPNTCMIGGTPVSHRALGWMSGWFASGGDMYLAWQTADPQDRMASAVAMSYAISEQASHAGLVDTWSRVFKAIANGGKDLGDYLRDRVEGAALIFPSHIGAVRAINQWSSDGLPLPGTMPGRTGDQGHRDLVAETYKIVMQQMTAGWPGWEAGQPQMRNQFDGTIIPRPGLFKGVVDAESPTAKVAAEIDRLGSTVRGNKFNVTTPKRTIGGSAPAVEGAPAGSQSPYAPLNLEPWEYDRKIQLMTSATVSGRTLVEAMTREIASDKYQLHAKAEESSAMARANGYCAQRLREIYQQYETKGEQLLLHEDKHLRWEIAKSEIQADNLGRLIPKPIPKEPDVVSYPRPGQNTRK